MNCRGKARYVLPLNPTAEEVKHWNQLYVKKQWRDRNKDKVAICNKSEGSRLSRNKYKEQNREKVLATMRKYYDENKEKYRERVVCEDCGKDYAKTCATSHKRTKFHQQALIFNELKVKTKLIE